MDELDYFPAHHRNQLFRSPEWISAWKASWLDHPAIVQLDQDFCRTTTKKKGVLRVNTAFPVGISTTNARSIRCEYLFTQGMLHKAMKLPWDELWLPDMVCASDDYQQLLNEAPRLGLHLMIVEQELSYAVDLRTGTFQDYLAKLSANTRPKLYNRRKKLEAAGQITLTNLWPDKERFFDLLNGFHERRWGTPCYQGRNFVFIKKLLDELTQAGKKVDLSVMEMDSTPISVMLDIHAGGRCYNLQSGYKEDLISGVSLGTLHFGYQIEAAFNAGLELYDFMAGKGKNHQYKAALSNTTTQLASVMLVKNPLLKLFYKIYHRLQRRAHQQPDAQQPSTPPNEPAVS